MKNFCFLFLALFGFGCVAQQNIVHLDKNKSRTEGPDYVYTRVISPADDAGNFDVKIYYRSGKLESEGISDVAEYERYDGLVTSYFESGQKSRIQTYKNGMPEGLAEYWYEDGKMAKRVVVPSYKSGGRPMLILDAWDKDGKQTVTKGNGYYRSSEESFTEEGAVKDSLHQGLWKGNLGPKYTYEEKYEKGILVKGIGIDAEGNKTEYTTFEVRPEPIGGIGEFYKYISKKFRVPYNNKVWGKIVLSFIVEKDGSLADIKVVKALSEELDAEAVRVLSKSGKWKPGLQRGRAVRCIFSLPITLHE